MLADLWKRLERAESSGAPDRCPGLVSVPFTLDRETFGLEFRLRVTGWYHPGPEGIIEPFGSVPDMVVSLRDALIRRHHLCCCGVEVPGVANSVISVHYENDGLGYWVALPGVSYARPPAGERNP